MDSKSNIIDIKAQNISIVPVTSLKPKQNNRNFHPDDQIQRLAELFKYQGFRNPLIVSNQSGEIVCGNGRYLAALRAGIKELPVIFQDFESTEQEYSYHVSDNAVSLWAELDLSGINNDLQELGPDFDLNMLGIKDFVLEPMDKYENQDPDAVPEVPKEPKSKLGDLYELGNHRLLCGDSTDKATVEKLMNGEKADMVFTDPPYGISIVKGSVGGSKAFGKFGDGKIVKANSYTPIIGDDTIQTAVSCYNLCVGLKIETLIFWGGNYYASALPDSSCWIVWDKENTGDFADAELAWTNQKTAVRIFKHMWNGMIKASEHGQRRAHPTQKPIALAEWCFENYGKPNSVLDLFGGSGSTLIACEKTNRKCFMCELDPHYIQVIIERYIKFTGRDDVYLINDDGSKTKWSDISEKR